MASEYCIKEISRGRTHLAAVYEQTIANHPQWNRIFSLNGQEQLQEQAHDAAFDAYMTGAAFCGLSYTIHDQIKYPPADPNLKFAIWDTDDQDELTPWHYGRNKMHFSLSPYTIDLESPESDPLTKGMSARSTFRVAGIDPSVTTRDIVRCLTGHVDSLDQRVNFEIVWVDDTTFLVGAMLQDCRDDTRFQEHGDIVFNALSNRFRRETIQPLEPLKESEPALSVWNLWGWFRPTKRPREVEEMRSSKKQRVE
jgi:hypothetical protein